MPLNSDGYVCAQHACRCTQQRVTVCAFTIGSTVSWWRSVLASGHLDVADAPGPIRDGRHNGARRPHFLVQNEATIHEVALESRRRKRFRHAGIPAAPGWRRIAARWCVWQEQRGDRGGRGEAYVRGMKHGRRVCADPRRENDREALQPHACRRRRGCFGERVVLAHRSEVPFAEVNRVCAPQEEPIAVKVASCAPRR